MKTTFTQYSEPLSTLLFDQTLVIYVVLGWDKLHALRLLLLRDRLGWPVFYVAMRGFYDDLFLIHYQCIGSTALEWVVYQHYVPYLTTVETIATLLSSPMISMHAISIEQQTLMRVMRESPASEFCTGV